MSGLIAVEGKASSRLEADMKFVLVNGGSPPPESFCPLCCEAIGENYLRELSTLLSYCSYECYLGHCKLSVSVLTERARAS